MARWVRLAALAALVLVACVAEDEEEPPTYSEEEWKDLQANIMNSMPDEEEEETSMFGHGQETDEKLLEAARRGRPAVNEKGEKFPFLEYSGYLEEDEGRDANIHVGTMDLEAAKQWCVDHDTCVGFTHNGEPTDDVVECFFKDVWKLGVDEKESWTSYQKGHLMENYEKDEVKKETGKMARAFHCEIQTCSG